MQRGHDLPSQTRGDGIVPVMGSSGVTGFHTEAKAKGPGVIIGRSGASIGRISYVDEDYWPLNTCMYVTDFKGNDPRFVYSFLSTLNLSGHNSGSAQPSLNRNYIYPIQIDVPNPPEQREIAAILGALDDKIEVNRKASATLDEMARALYRSWFVDFDPVHARAQGRPPAHMPPETAALFPDSFGDNGLPEGWIFGTLAGVASQSRQSVKPDQISPETPYIGLEHMPRKSIALPDWGTAADIGSQKSSIAAGEFLFGKLRPYFHKVGIAPVDGICSTDIIVIRPNALDWAGFVLSVISSDEFVEHTNAGSSGTRMPRTNWSDMAAYGMPLPSDTVAAAFEMIVRPWRERIVSGIHENRTLAALRDSLLPKLMSGEIRVGDARSQVEEVA
ncbi:restriction endonuclease subunit S [Sulfitobacter sp. 1A12126]|uniref:restriction endonuclease subunit S n=1 Tax=Sulfitobacter sp. 1A12126 TaxID=3368591 RepID=UPI003747C50F